MIDMYGNEIDWEMDSGNEDGEIQNPSYDIDTDVNSYKPNDDAYQDDAYQNDVYQDDAYQDNASQENASQKNNAQELRITFNEPSEWEKSDVTVVLWNQTYSEYEEIVLKEEEWSTTVEIPAGEYTFYYARSETGEEFICNSDSFFLPDSIIIYSPNEVYVAQEQETIEPRSTLNDLQDTQNRLVVAVVAVCVITGAVISVVAVCRKKFHRKGENSKK